MADNNKMNQGQNDLSKSQKPGMGSEKVSNAGVGNQDQNKNLNKNPGQNQKIDQDADIGSRQQQSSPNQGRGGQGNVQSDLDDDRSTQRTQRGNIDREGQK